MSISDENLRELCACMPTEIWLGDKRGVNVNTLAAELLEARQTLRQVRSELIVVAAAMNVLPDTIPYIEPGSIKRVGD